jgi:hypothetical protein
MKSVLLVLVTLSVTAMAEVKCEKDMRPVDGNYNALELVKNSNDRYDAFYAVITAGFGSPVSKTRVLIAKNLKCHALSTNPVITECLKSSSEEGEEINSGLNINLVETVSVSGIQKTYNVTVYSPQLIAGKGKPGFPPMDRPGRAKLEFSAEKNSSSFMLNRCQAN